MLFFVSILLVITIVFIVKLEKKITILEGYKKLYNDALEELKAGSTLLPSLIRWHDNLKHFEDDSIVTALVQKRRPAYKAALEIKNAKAEAREAKKELELARNRVQLYESLAPWLIDYTDISLEDMLLSLHEEKMREQHEFDEEIDPVSKYISRSEWQQLTPSDRNQLALERYKDPKRKKSLWEVGIEYERFIGYTFEQKGYTVQYHGALNGKEDLGIDLICENDRHILIVQCKRLSRDKAIPVRENVIAQTYGTAQHYKMKKKCKKEVAPVIITTYELSNEAMNFAKYLGVQVMNDVQIQEYPRIKCNISNNNKEKIYHLPMDQQYDKVIIGDVDGEFYAWNVKEAENNGFRRAYKWKGTK
ncbi:restriction endonuclease [Sulfuricurvum sp.]|uniref:restriction endonuclease n=1 Tax=Sulfuricurvum sp. TaxID=2025608 RepID=UPI003BB51B97